MLTQFYPPIIGGEENHVRTLAAALAKRGHEVAVATLWRKDLAEFEIDQGVRIYRIRATTQRIPGLYSNTAATHTPPVPDPETVYGLSKIVQKERPEVVHAHNWFIHSFLPLKAWSKAKLVLTLHDMSLVCTKKAFIYQGEPCTGPGFSKCITCTIDHYGLLKALPSTFGNWTMGIVERASVDMFLSVSECVASFNGLTASRYPNMVIPNFVPDSVGTLPSNVDPCLNDLPPDGYLLYVGDLRRLKGAHDAITAYEKLQAAGVKDLPPLVLIGSENPDTPKQLPPNVHMFKSWRHDAVMHAWSRSSIGLVPSILHDACPTTVMEAMGMGKPVVGTRMGGIPDLIADGETGFIVPARDTDKLSQAIRRLVEDTALRQKMGEAGKQRVVNFTAGTVIPRIEQVYRDLLAN